jgi:hypothetical protein
VHHTTNPVALAVTLGEHYWGGAPCHGEVLTSGTTTAPPENVLAGPAQGELAHGAVVLGWAGYTSSNPADAATYTACQIFFNLAFWRDWRTEAGNFQWFCDMMTHELGHLFGHPDAGQTDARSIEYPLLSPETPNYDQVPQCRSVHFWIGGMRFGGDLSDRRVRTPS